jgi:hypothetical protein
MRSYPSRRIPPASRTLLRAVAPLPFLRPPVVPPKRNNQKATRGFEALLPPEIRTDSRVLSQQEGRNLPGLVPL